MDERLIRSLREAGASEACIQDLIARLDARSRRIPLGIVACPACGSRPLRYDYACGACGQVKARRQRRFWQYVMEREEGGTGRPKPRKPRPQQLPKVDRPGEILVLLDPLPEPPPPPRFEWLVQSGHGGIVLVAEWAFEAVRWAKILLGAGETAGATWICLGPTDQPVSVKKDKEHELRSVFEEVAP